MRNTRQASSNYYGFQFRLEDNTPLSPLEGGTENGTTPVVAPSSAKLYVSDGSSLLINGATCQIDDNGDGTVNISYRPTVTEIAAMTQKQIQVQAWMKWADVDGKAVEQWTSIERVTLLPNLA